MNILFTGSLVILAYLFSKYLMALFITDPQVVVLGQQLLFIVLWSILFFGASAIFASIMRASGTVTAPMLINIIAIIGIEVPAAYMFSRWWGLQRDLVWLCLGLCLSLYHARPVLPVHLEEKNHRGTGLIFRPELLNKPSKSTSK